MRAVDPQECYLGPRNISIEISIDQRSIIHNSKYFLGPKNSSWGRNHEEAEQTGLHAAIAAVAARTAAGDFSASAA